MKAVPLIGIARHRLTIDGEGVTTLVAFHGCPLRCKYCLNPTSLQPDGVWERFDVGFGDAEVAAVPLDVGFGADQIELGQTHPASAPLSPRDLSVSSSDRVCLPFLRRL